MAKICYDQWSEERGKKAGQIEWDKLKGAFLDRFFLLELREDKVQDFINLKQGHMNVREFPLKFNMLSKYIPFILLTQDLE